MTSYTVKFTDKNTELKVNKIKRTKLNVFWGKETIIPDTFFAQDIKIFESQANVV